MSDFAHSFWGVTIKANNYAVVIPPVFHNLKVTQVSLSYEDSEAKSDNSERNAKLSVLSAEIGVMLCKLREKVFENSRLDFVFPSQIPITFYNHGNCDISLSGYLKPLKTKPLPNEEITKTFPVERTAEQTEKFIEKKFKDKTPKKPKDPKKSEKSENPKNEKVKKSKKEKLKAKKVKKEKLKEKKKLKLIEKKALKEKEKNDKRSKWKLNGLIKYFDFEEGTGNKIKSGDFVKILYASKNEEGKPIDSVVDKEKPFGFRFDKGEVIKGWDLGMNGMKFGGKRKLIVPAKLNVQQGVLNKTKTGKMIYTIKVLDNK